ncbi:MAG: glycoside-pentoside-hexuronide (GPH):cation symporter [Clostridiales bacterium]|nr:glycoside-pentoside-hexuronide (GPH):cation symporter [Clostridiales bacterium]
MAESSLTHGIKFKDKVGYALGDAGGLLTFSLIGAFQNKFYTDALGIKPESIILLILIARIWDAINDPLWGAFVQSRKPKKSGQFRPWIIGFSIPLAISAVLMFFKIPGLNGTQYLIYAYITYIAYGMMYTAVNIPYGSLASVVTDDELERSSLSMWRSIGAGVGGLPGTIVLPMIVFTVTGKYANGTDIKALDDKKLFYCVLVLAAVSVLVYFLHYKMTKERIAPQEKKKDEHYNAVATVKALFRNRAFVTLSLASMLLIAFQFYYQSTYTYLFTDYYGKPGLYAFVTICTYGPMAIFIPIMNRLIRKFGKKELCAVGMAFAAVANIGLFVLRWTALAHNPFVFLGFTFLSGLGQTFLVLEVWALVMDVIDYHEVRTGKREEGMAYAVFSFTRKLGQTLAGVGLNALLAFIKYDGELSKQGKPLGEDVLSKLYDISTIVPAVMLALMAIILFCGYNLSKSKLVEVHEQLAEVRKQEEA